MDVLPGLDRCALRELGVTVVDGNLFDRHDAVASRRKHRAGHNFDACGA